MRRAVGLERTYVLGAYKNLKVTDFISDIPEHLFLNPETMQAISALQWSRLDAVYYDYTSRSPMFVDGITREEAVEIIEEVRMESFEKLMQATASDKKAMENKEQEDEIELEEEE